MNGIDTSFDVRTDARGKDPDAHSPTLRRYHRILWSKPLPNGNQFRLTEKGSYLHPCSPLEKFVLSSDSIIQTFLRWDSLKHTTSQLPVEENEAFFTIACTVGATIVFPAYQVDGKWTINQARGCNRSISDRFDLTLECIRRHYLGQPSPLSDCLARYGDFFDLFNDFRGYVDFFLLRDLVTDDYQIVKFFMPFNDFKPPAVPKDPETYRGFCRRSIDFIRARNQRIDEPAAASG